MSQKNKIFSITLLLLILGSVACRKSGGGGDPTPIDPTKSMTGDLLIVSVDGKTNLNSIPLRFAGANATVTKVAVEQGKNLNLDTNNFIVENNALKLTNIDLSTAEAAVSNKITLTFDLSASSSSPITRYTDTADIFVGKMQTNISVETFKKLQFHISDTVTGRDNIDGDNLVQTTKHQSILFNNRDFQVDASDDSKFILENGNTGNAANELKMSEFSTILSNSFNSNQDISTYNNNAGFEITSSTEGTKATFVIKFKPFNSFYKEHSITFDQKLGAWIE